MPVASSGLVPSQAVSRRLRPSSTVPVSGCFMLVLSERRARSGLHADLRSNVECGDQSPLTNGFTLRSWSARVKSLSTVCCRWSDVGAVSILVMSAMNSKMNSAMRVRRRYARAKPARSASARQPVRSNGIGEPEIHTANEDVESCGFDEFPRLVLLAACAPGAGGAAASWAGDRSNDVRWLTVPSQ